MSERRTIGQILTSVGRITEDDVTVALEYQRDNGGYFGEALVACDLVTAEELEWGLASQFDIPYVFPQADAVDPEAAALVTPEWALAHLTLPIMKTAETLQVVVDSPTKTDVVEELRRRTDLDIQLALASGSTIRELIRQVYARGTAADEQGSTPVEVADAFDAALQADAPRFGVSVRGSRAYAWWDDRGTVRRRVLAGDWRTDLDRMVIPGPSEMTGGTTRTRWDADINRLGLVTTVEVQYIADESGREYLFKPGAVDAELEQRFDPPGAGVLSEIRLLARSGTARFIVTADPAEVGHQILPSLPTLLLDPSWRSIYITAQSRDEEEKAFSLRIPPDPKKWETEIEALRAFHFDVVTVNLTGGDRTWAGSALDVASVAFLLWDSEEDTKPAYDAGIRWHLRIERRPDDTLVWSLEPLNV